MSSSKKILIFFASIFLFLFSANHVLAQTKTPLIAEAVYEKGVVKVIGLTQADSEVYVDINGITKGQAQVNSEATETDNFSFAVKQVLSQGEYIVNVQAVNPLDGSVSAISQAKILVIERPLSAPTLLSPAKDDIIGVAKPLIIGLSRSDVLVHVYIDGVHYGKTDWLSHQSGTANFAYEPFLNLEVGQHKVWAVAEDENGRKSKISNVLEFTVEHPMPAPTMFQPVVNASSTASQPFIVGLAKNDSEIKVFIDNKLSGSFLVKNHESGTANFAFQPPAPLTRGAHVVYTQALDKRGKISQKSNIIHYTVKEPQIGQSAEDVKTTADDTAKPQDSKETEDTGADDEQIEKIKDIIDGIGDEPDSQTEELVELLQELEQSEQQENGSLRTNVIIFVLFLIGIIFWIFWVNKELVKERKQAKDDSKDNNETGDKKQ